MAAASADRNLLFGILALQLDFISRDQLVAAMNAWVLEKNTALGELLLRQGALGTDKLALLDGLVKAHLALHGDDPHQSLAAFSSVSSVKEMLDQVADRDLHQSLAVLPGTVAYRPAAKGETPDGAEGADPNATVAPAAVGQSSEAVGQSSASSVRFRILRPHREGGLGEVVVAFDGELHREVALKKIKDRHADDPDARARFVREGEITGKLEHPGIVPIYSLGHYGNGRPFYAMRFVKGDSLEEAIKEFHQADAQPRSDSDRALELRKLLGRFVDVCEAISYAHSRGVLHRDLKPGNIMLGRYGETLVVDWGLAKTQGEDDSEPPASASLAPVKVASGSGSTPTEMGSVLGTPAYMSPEQPAGRLGELGPASDVYSLGARLYALLTGHAPIEGEHEVARILVRVCTGDIPPPRLVNAKVPAALEAVCCKAMALKAKDRYATAQEVAEDVERWLADEPVRAWPEPATVRARRWMRRHRAVVTGAAAALLVGLVSLVGLNFILAERNQQLQVANDAVSLKEQEVSRKERETRDANEQLKSANEAVSQREQETRQANEKLKSANEAVNRQEQETRQANEKLKSANEAVSQREQETRQANEKLKSANDEIRTANQKLDLEKRLAEENLAITTMMLARSRFEDNNAGLADNLLEQIPKEYRGSSWGLLKNYVAGSLFTPYGDTGVVLSVSYSPDGLTLASASGDRTVRLWDVKTGQDRSPSPAELSYRRWVTSPDLQWHKDFVEQLQKSDPAAAAFHLGWYLAARDYYAALKDQPAAKSGPGSAILARGRIWAGILQKTAGPALVPLLAEAAQGAAQLDAPWQTHALYGAALYRAGDGSKALQELTLALKQRGQHNVWLAAFLAMTCAQLGDNDKATAWRSKLAPPKAAAWEEQALAALLRPEVEATAGAKK